jgi:hypothetical protein
MYLTHFGLTHYPFERALEPDELFASSAVCEAQVRLTHLVELRGIGLITARSDWARPRRAAGSPPRCTRGCTGCSTCRCPGACVMDMYKAMA